MSPSMPAIRRSRRRWMTRCASVDVGVKVGVEVGVGVKHMNMNETHTAFRRNGSWFSFLGPPCKSKSVKTSFPWITFKSDRKTESQSQGRSKLSKQWEKRLHSRPGVRTLQGKHRARLYLTGHRLAGLTLTALVQQPNNVTLAKWQAKRTIIIGLGFRTVQIMEPGNKTPNVLDMVLPLPITPTLWRLNQQTVQARVDFWLCVILLQRFGWARKTVTSHLA